MVVYLDKIPLDETERGADQSASALEPPASAEGAVGGYVPDLQGPARIVRAARDASRLRPPGYVGSPTVAEVRAAERAVRLNNAAEKRRREAAARPTPGVPPPPAVAQRLRMGAGNPTTLREYYEQGCRKHAPEGPFLPGQPDHAPHPAVIPDLCEEDDDEGTVTPQPKRKPKPGAK